MLPFNYNRSLIALAEVIKDVRNTLYAELDIQDKNSIRYIYFRMFHPKFFTGCKPFFIRTRTIEEPIDEAIGLGLRLLDFNLLDSRLPFRIILEVVTDTRHL